MVIMDEKPFKMVESEGFKLFVKALQPKFILPSRVTISRDCLSVFEDEKNKLKQILKSQRVCLTSDAWTSIQNLSYMCLTAHWIDPNWKLQKRVVNFCLIPNHKGETIGEMIEWCLRDWRIDGIFTVTLDNASSNNGAIKYLKRRTRDWKGTIMGNELMHVRCCAHIINLIVREAFDEHDETIQKIRKAVKFVRSSPSRLEAFKKCVIKEQIHSKKMLCLDVDTRWNSAYLMLESAEKFERAFERLAREDSKYILYFSGLEDEGIDNVENNKRRSKSKMVNPPDEDDWSKARCFIKFLKLFYEVTLKFSASLHVTSNAFFHELIAIKTRLATMIKSGDLELSLMAEKMKVKFDKYWEDPTKMNVLLFIAVILEARYKLRYVKFWFEKIYEPQIASDLTNMVESTFNNLYEHYCERYGSNIVGGNASNSKGATVGVVHEGTSSVVDVEDVEENYSDFVKSQFKLHLIAEGSLESKSEVAKYLAESCEDVDDGSFDILYWWKTHATTYHVLSYMAKDVLAIPISTVASESAFSTGGRILDPFRSFLSPKMVEALVCAQNWLRSEKTNCKVEEVDDVTICEDLEKELLIARSTCSVSIKEPINI